MAASMNCCGLLRGHCKNLLRPNVLSKSWYCTEADSLTEYEKKLHKIRDCSGLSNNMRRRFHGESPELSLIKRYKKNDQRSKLRRLYGVYGAATGINPKLLLPSTAELQDLKEIERDWTPTFQQLKEELENKKSAEAAQARMRDEKIELAMGKMDQLIEQHKQKLQKNEEVDKKKSEATELLLEQFQEQYGFSVSEHSAKFRIFRQLKAKESRELKKQQKKQSKKEHSLKTLENMLKVQEKS